MLKDWKLGLEGNPAVDALRAEVEAFAESFEMPGFTRDSVDM
jgi:glycine hydroxymethyltransferase